MFLFKRFLAFPETAAIAPQRCTAFSFRFDARAAEADLVFTVPLADRKIFFVPSVTSHARRVLLFYSFPINYLPSWMFHQQVWPFLLTSIK